MTVTCWENKDRNFGLKKIGNRRANQINAQQVRFLYIFRKCEAEDVCRGKEKIKKGNDISISSKRDLNLPVGRMTLQVSALHF